MPDIPELTHDQQTVVDWSVDSRTLVAAGPGAGKTHTLVSRIERLVDTAQDIAGQEVLSLSFSRAAVGELRRRLAALSNRGSRVRSTTFDSFATRLLATYGDVSLEGMNYDRRIELAMELIQVRPIDELSEIRHICVDEAQDLIGVRADFVLRLFEVTNCGFTVFADQAQAVYDFAGEAAQGPSFVERVAEAYGALLNALVLTTNHRTNDPQLLNVCALGSLIRETSVDRAEVVKRFDNAVHGLAAAGSIEDAALMLQGNSGTAVLTRRNSEALAISAVLYRSGVEHQLRRRADDPVVGSWLSRLSRTAGSHRITAESLEAASSTLPWAPDITWAALSRVVRPRKGVMNLDQIAENLAVRIPPDELIDNGTDGVVVSTIHRAKGLEFDTVLLVPFDIDEDDWLQEARVLYVGLTRAKRNLLTLRKVDDKRWSYLPPPASRWRRIRFAGKRRYTTGIEVSGSDAISFDPTGASPTRHNPADLADYILSAVTAGDPVILERRTSDSRDCIYDVTHNGQWVAATNPRFGEIVTRQVEPKPPPSRIEGCRIETVSTTALPASVAEILGTQEQLVPNCRIQGVGTW